MVFFNWATMQMAAKIVYYGPGLCGKTTNLSYIYAKTAPSSRGEMVSLETESDRTLFFDLLPIEVGTIGGFKTRLQLYTVPGQVFYNTTRKLVLKGVDGIVFVADSQRPMREANKESFRNLRENLAELGLDLDDIPLVLQYNKRDLKNILTIEELNADLNPDGRYSWFEASAINGQGVFETLKAITKLTLRKLRKRMTAPAQEAAPAPRPAPPSRPVAPPAPPPAPQPAAPAPAPPRTISAAALARAAEEGVSAPEAGPAPPAPEPEAVEAPAPEPEAVEAPAPEPEAVEAPAPATAPAAEEIEELPPEAELEPAEEGEGGVSPDSVTGEVAVPGHLREGMEAAARAGAEELAEIGEAEEEPEVEFATEAEAPAEVTPPPMKHVKVSSQMDILAELENLRKQATMGGRPLRQASTADVDLDALLGTTLDQRKEIRRRLARKLNSDIFRRLRSVEVAVRLRDADGETITTLDPLSVAVENAADLNQLLLSLTVDLENLK